MHRGSVRFDGSRQLRFEITEPREGPGASRRDTWGLLWTHGLTFSMHAEDMGAWPFPSLGTALAHLLPVARHDARGHGSSDMAADGSCTWRDLGQDLVRLRHAWTPSTRKIVLGGTSMGAAASLCAMLEDPTNVAGLILAPPPTCYESRSKFLPMYRSSAEIVRTSGLEAAKREAEGYARPPIFMQTEAGRKMFDLCWDERFSMGADRYCAALQGAVESDLPPREQLRAITVPTLILAWESDVQHPVEAARILKETLPAAELHIVNTWAGVESLPSMMATFLERLLPPEGR